ncbi:MAG: hypothetical protein R2787_07320 [Saprospiraceae bacterium]
MEAYASQRAKIDDLFRGRRLDWLYAQSPLSHDQTYYEQLILLQAAIYDLDAFLERSWIIAPEELNEYWRIIHDRLAAFHLNEPDRERKLRDIKVYQTHELLTRTGGNPITIPITEFYHYKTCDVRLIRQLIYEGDPRLGEKMPEAVWRYYDWLTEVQDDLEDQEEDRDTYNVNRYLFAMDHLGPDKARATYLSYIRHISSAARETLREEDFPYRAEYQEWIQDATEKVKFMLQ